MFGARFFLVGIIGFMGALTANAAPDVLVDLNALPGVSAQETTVAGDTALGLRRFILQVEQPVDHFDSAAGTFKQKLVLFHRDYSEPMVLQTSGYSIFSEKLSRVANAFATNQIQVEHRFFSTSAPEPKDWSKLTVRQSAEDFHHIVQIFKTLYQQRWVNTGASKGGMTSIFHRRYFPHDLDGTVADVAPLSFTTEDPRYIGFLEQVGGVEFMDCRAKLDAFQSTVLKRRLELLPSITGSFTSLGSNEVALEHSVIEAPFAFWQYGNPEDANFGCAKVPGPQAKASEIMAFLTQVNDPNGLNDEGIAGFQPYYYQAALELGAPGSNLTNLQGLLQFPYELTQYLPGHAPVTYTDVTMRDMKNWAAQEAVGMMFVYGEFDPWSAGAYTEINSAAQADNHWYQVPRFNHGSNFTKLPDPLKADAIAVLTRWLGKSPAPVPLQHLSLQINGAAESLEDTEMRAIRRRHSH